MAMMPLLTNGGFMRSARACDVLANWLDTANVADIARVAAGLGSPTLPRATRALDTATIRDFARMQLQRIVHREEMTGALLS